MSTLQNEERLCRKSSVYNQTGETYFQQLSAYNHMSAHLRRVLLAPCVVDSRNKRYSRSKGLASGRFYSRSKSLDKIRTQDDIIDGIAYDTRHHPLDVLRKSLECSNECHREVNEEVSDVCGRCNDRSARSRGSRAGVTSCTIAQRMGVNSEAGGKICKCLHLQPCKPCSSPALKGVSPKWSRLNGGSRRIGGPTIADRREWKRRSGSDRSRTIKAPPSRSKVQRSEPSYVYDSSFESSSENSTAPGSPILKLSEINRGSRAESPGDVVNRETNNKSFETEERTEEAKYAKFIYDITQEITINGLYTDDDLHTIFKKHIDMNSETLDRNKMQSEIHRLKMALNVRGSSEDEEMNDIDRLASAGKFAKFSLEKTPTPSKILEDYNVEGKTRQNEASLRFGEARRPKSSHGKSTVVLVDPNPELLITEQDVVLTLKEMKLDPRQIQSICKSLQKRSREIAPSQLVKNYAETSSLKRGQIRSNSPIDSRTGSRTIDAHRSDIDRKLQNASDSPRKNETWQCRCTDSPRAEESQAKVQPEMEILPSPSHTRGDRINIAFTDGITEPSIITRSVRSTESRKIYGPAQNNEKQIMELNISHTSLLGSKKLSQESLRTLGGLVSNKSSQRKNENREAEEEEGNTAKIRMQRTRTIQAGDRSESTEKGTDEEQERTSNVKIRTSPPTAQSGRAHEPKSLPELKLKSKSDEIEEAPETRNFRNSSPPNEEADIMFVSHSRFLSNLRKGDVSSLPDISERSEGVTEEIATDENVKNIRETTSHRSRIEQVTDDKTVNFTEQTSQIDVVSIDNESSEISENIDALEAPSLTDVAEGKIVEVVMSQTRGLPATEENSADRLSPSSIHQTSRDSENDEDSDENKRVVVAALKPSSSSALIPKITLSTLKPAVDEKQAIVAENENLSARISENEDCKSSDESPKNSTKKRQPEESYSLKVVSTSNGANKNSDTSSIETELDQQETLHSTSEIQVEEEKMSSKDENEDEESRKLYELAEQSDRSSTKIHKISKSKSGVYPPDRDSIESERNLKEKSENSKKQRGKQQIRYTRFSRLIGKGNRQRNSGREETLETSGEKLRISEKDKKKGGLFFLDENVTTASDISFLRKQNLNDSAQLSNDETFLDSIDRQDSRGIERSVAKSRSLGNSYTSMYSKKEWTSENLIPRPEVTPRRQHANQSKNSISRRMKAAVGSLIKRSSKCTQMDGNNKNLPRNVSSGTTDSQVVCLKVSPRAEAAETIASTTLAINSQKSGCVCVLTMKNVQKNRIGNCRPDCRGRGFVCDQRCSLYNRILQ